MNYANHTDVTQAQEEMSNRRFRYCPCYNPFYYRIVLSSTISQKQNSTNGRYHKSQASSQLRRTANRVVGCGGRTCRSPRARCRCTSSFGGRSLGRGGSDRTAPIKRHIIRVTENSSIGADSSCLHPWVRSRSVLGKREVGLEFSLIYLVQLGIGRRS